VDNKICIWDLEMTSPLQVLDKHTGYVKGLSWDPIGQFLISQGED